MTWPGSDGVRSEERYTHSLGRPKSAGGENSWSQSLLRTSAKGFLVDRLSFCSSINCRISKIFFFMTRKSKKKSAIILAAINLNSQRSAFALLGASYSQCGQSSFPLGILLPSPSLPREHHCYPHPGAWLSHLHFRKSGLEVGLKKHDHILFGAKK